MNDKEVQPYTLSFLGKTNKFNKSQHNYNQLEKIKKHSWN